jgi:hypothetical protein
MYFRLFTIAIFSLSWATAVLADTSQKPHRPTTYYVDALRGNDEAGGTTTAKAWKTLARASQQHLQAGDRLLLRRGQVFHGELNVTGHGNARQRVLVGAYGQGDMPRIEGYDRSLWALKVSNSDYLTLKGIEIVNTGKERKAHRTGLLIECMDYGVSRNITVDSVVVRDVNGSLVKSEGGGCGILIRNGGKTTDSRFDSLLIQNCHIVRCARNAIIWSGYYNRHHWVPSTNTVVRGNLIEQVPGDGIVPIGCVNTLIEYNVIRDCPDILPDTEAAAGIWPWSCDSTTIQFNDVSGHKAPWDAQGYDCDYNCRNTVIQYNYSHQNYGGLVLVCNNGEEHNYSLGNRNSVVRYNISIGDGVRPKPTRTGKMFSPGIHIAGSVVHTNINHNIIHSPGKPRPDMDRTMICSDSWGGYADSTTITDNIFYTAELSKFDMQRSTHNFFDHNWYLGDYDSLPQDNRQQLASMFYQEKIVDADPMGYVGLQQLMNERTVYGIKAYAIDAKKIHSFFEAMEQHL